MQNQQEDTFVFGQSVKGFLKRYEADAKFAQEARKKAEGVLDDTVQLVCPDDIRPLALTLLRRLKNSEKVLFSFYSAAGKNVKRRARDQLIRKEFSQRLQNHANFAKFVMYEVAPAAACGRLDLRCKREHRRILKELLQELWDEQSATRNGWQTLVKRTHPLTGSPTLTKVAPWDLEEDFMQNSGRDFQVMQRLGYKANITCEEASELDARDPTYRVSLFGASAPSFEHARFVRDSSRNLDPLLSPHFGDDDDIEERALVAERADELVSEASDASYQVALSELDQEFGPKVSDFVPPLPPQKCGRGGLTSYWATELVKGVVVHKAPRTQGPRWPHKAPSDTWLESRKAAEKASEEARARTELLAADDAEVREHQFTDVSETIVGLLETQLEKVDRKAPKGVVGALAHARLEASETAKRISEQTRGLGALTEALNAV